MPSNPVPIQPLTDAEFAEMRNVISGGSEASNKPESLRIIGGRLLADVDRLQAALTAISRNERAAANRSLEMQDENDRLRAQVQDYHKSADAHVAKFDRQHERLMEAEEHIVAARKALFDDAFEGHAQRYRAVAQALGDPDE
jgi:hypothetical protein